MGEANVCAEKPSGFSHYLDALFQLRCTPDLLAAGLFPNAKEWTEAYGLYRRARQYLGADLLGRRDVLALDVGCGKKPRLAGLVACMSRWSVAAIDPRLDAPNGYGSQHHRIHGLTLYPCKIQDIREPFTHDSLVVSFHCHSHAPLPEVVKRVRAPRHVVIAMACCETLFLPGIAPVFEEYDPQILSPKSLVRIWDLDAALARAREGEKHG